jgi:hypothetical protein
MIRATQITSPAGVKTRGVLAASAARMSSAVLAGLAGLTIGSGSSAAADLRVSTQNMRLALELCLRNSRDTGALPQVFGQAGFNVFQSDGTYWEFSAPGIFGGFSTASQGASCNVQSQDVPLRIAEEMGLKLAQSLFPGKVELGSPERNTNTPPGPCEGMLIFAPRQLLVLSYSAAGNSGECLNDGTSAVLINM